MKAVPRIFKIHYARNMSLTGYDLSRNWFDFSYENTDIVTPTHSGLMMWIIEKWNRLGQIPKFGLPSYEAMTALGIKHHATYKKAYNDLVTWGFISVVTESKNQYTANIIALSKNSKAHSRALSRHLARHVSEHPQGTCAITKPRTKNQEPLKGEVAFENVKCTFSEETKAQWMELCEIKKWKGKEVKTLEASLKRLMKFDEAFASELISNSLSNGYQGVVFPDTQQKYEAWKLANTFKPQKSVSTHIPNADDQW